MSTINRITLCLHTDDPEDDKTEFFVNGPCELTIDQPHDYVGTTPEGIRRMKSDGTVKVTIQGYRLHA